MPAGFTDAIREIGLFAQVDRSLWVELHTDDPGNPNAATPLTRTTIANRITPGTNAYYGKYIAKGGMVVEGSSSAEARYANNADVDFGSASGGVWGTISWISIWYDANDAEATDPVRGDSTKFDALFAIMQLQTPQAVGDGDPFVIRANTIDLVSQNAA